MKKIYIGLFLTTHILYASQSNQTTTMTVDPGVDIARLTVQVESAGRSSSLRESSEHAMYAFDMSKAWNGFVTEKKPEIEHTSAQVADLRRKAESFDVKYVEIEQQKFDPTWPKSRAVSALARYNKLLIGDQWEQARFVEIPGVEKTPDGIRRYWQAKIDGDLGEEYAAFGLSKSQRLAVIEQERSPIVAQLQKILDDEKLIEHAMKYAKEYHDLYVLFFQAHQDKAVEIVTNQVRRRAAMNHLNLLREDQQAKFEQQQNAAAVVLQSWMRSLEPQRQLSQLKLQNQLALLVQPIWRGILGRRQADIVRKELLEQEKLNKEIARKLLLVQRAKEEEEKIQRTKEAREMQSANDKRAHAEKLEREKEEKHKRNVVKRQADKDKLKKKSVGGGAQAGVSKSSGGVVSKKSGGKSGDRFFQIMELVDVSQEAVVNQAMQLVDNFGAVGSIENMKEASQQSRLIPLKNFHRSQLQELAQTLAFDTRCNFEQAQKRIEELKQQQELEIEAKELEHEELIAILEEYKALVANKITLNFPRCLTITQLLTEKDIAMRANHEEKGLSYFIACDPVYWVEISDSLEKWHYKFGSLKEADIDREIIKLDEDISEKSSLIRLAATTEIGQQMQNELRLMNDQRVKLSARKSVAMWLQLMESLLGDRGVLNPRAILGDVAMSMFKSPDLYRCLSDEDLIAIQLCFKHTVERSLKTPSTLAPNITVVMESVFEQLDMFPGNRTVIAHEYTVSLLQNFINHAGEKSKPGFENRIRQHYFDIFLAKNYTTNCDYSKAQIADFAKIYSSMIVMMLQAK